MDFCWAKWQWTKIPDLENIEKSYNVPIFEATGWPGLKALKLMNMECCNRCFFLGSRFIEKEGPWCILGCSGHHLVRD